MFFIFNAIGIKGALEYVEVTGRREEDRDTT